MAENTRIVTCPLCSSSNVQQSQIDEEFLQSVIRCNFHAKLNHQLVNDISGCLGHVENLLFRLMSNPCALGDISVKTRQELIESLSLVQNNLQHAGQMIWNSKAMFPGILGTASPDAERSVLGHACATMRIFHLDSIQLASKVPCELSSDEVEGFCKLQYAALLSIARSLSRSRQVQFYWRVSFDDACLLGTAILPVSADMNEPEAARSWRLAEITALVTGGRLSFIENQEAKVVYWSMPFKRCIGDLKQETETKSGSNAVVSSNEHQTVADVECSILDCARLTISALGLRDIELVSEVPSGLSAEQIDGFCNLQSLVLASIAKSLSRIKQAQFYWKIAFDHSSLAGTAMLPVTADMDQEEVARSWRLADTAAVDLGGGLSFSENPEAKIVRWFIPLRGSRGNECIT